MSIRSPDVIIVNFDSAEHLGECLSSVLEHAPASRAIVIDNASRDGSEQAAATAGPLVSLQQNSVNVGFGRAVNQALARTSTAAVLVLNPDCRLLAGAVEQLQAELAVHPECAIAAPAVLDEDGSLQGSVRGDPTMLTGLFGRTTLLTRLFPKSRAARRNVAVSSPEKPLQSREADWASGACMLVRRDAFEAVGGFDERYFLYWEDADLCRRLRARGYTTRYVPAARVVHTGGGSSRSARALAIRAFHRSAFTYYATHVARGPVSRSLAWLLLAGRCRLKLLASRLRAA